MVSQLENESYQAMGVARRHAVGPNPPFGVYIRCYARRCFKNPVLKLGGDSSHRGTQRCAWAGSARKGEAVIVGVYFSGTGNTKHCVETFVRLCDPVGTAVPLESPEVCRTAAGRDLLVLGYPVYFSNAPRIVQDFIAENGALFAGRRVFLIATMGLFSGDGTGCAARLLQRCGAEIVGGLHLKMPDCIGDEKVLKKSVEENRATVRRAEEKIADAARRLCAGAPTREGLGVAARMAGLFGQRLWFYGKTAGYKQKPDIDRKRCSGCGRCTRLCPMGNLALEGGKAVARGRCTLCYRCFGHCPEQALTILGKQVYEQCLFENYR